MSMAIIPWYYECPAFVSAPRNGRVHGSGSRPMIASQCRTLRCGARRKQYAVTSVVLGVAGSGSEQVCGQQMVGWVVWVLESSPVRRMQSCASRIGSAEVAASFMRRSTLARSSSWGPKVFQIGSERMRRAHLGDLRVSARVGMR